MAAKGIFELALYAQLDFAGYIFPKFAVSTLGYCRFSSDETSTSATLKVLSYLRGGSCLSVRGCPLTIQTCKSLLTALIPPICSPRCLEPNLKYGGLSYFRILHSATMKSFQNRTSRLFCLAWMLAYLSISVGCSPQEGVRSYRVAKAKSTSGAGSAAQTSEVGKPEQIVGAIVPQGQNVWYFKMQGNPDQVSEIQNEFLEIINSTSFAESGPVLEMPSGWTDRGPKGIATNNIVNDESGLSATVTPLFAGAATEKADQWQDYVLRNVNRWRGQVSLQEQAWTEVEPSLQELEKLNQEPAKAYFVSLVGKSSGSSMGGPFMNRGGPFSGGTAGGTPATPEPSFAAKKNLMYIEPEGWSEKDVSSSQMKLAAFDIGTGENKAELTVIPLSGKPVEHLKIWLDQAGATEKPDEVADRLLEKAENVTVNEAESKLYHYDGAEESGKSIMITEIPWRDGESLYVRLLGDAAVVNQQKQAMLEFLESMTW